MTHGRNLGDDRYRDDVGAGKPARRAPTNEVWYWSGVGATALVCAVTAIVGVIMVEGVLDFSLVPPWLNVFGLDGHIARYAAAAAVAAVLAGALLRLLSLSTPHPATFFRWIAVLMTVAAALVPFALTDILADALLTGLLNTVIGISVTTLLPAVAAQSRLRL
jgi:hypothetical protein